jgi:superfamily II DNA or RNA helicase
MKLELKPYQLKIVEGGKEKRLEGHKNVFFQAPTRSGKTVIFSRQAFEFITEGQLVKSSDFKEEMFAGDVLIIVHDEKLLNQTIKTIRRWYGIEAIKITSKTKGIIKENFFGVKNKYYVYVAMQQTLFNRMKISSFSEEMSKVKLIVADEAHLKNFNKIFNHPVFENALRNGFSATLNQQATTEPLYPFYFTSIVVGPSVKELIELEKETPGSGVVPCRTYRPFKKESRNLLNQIREQAPDQIDGDIDQEFVGAALSGKRHINNVVEAISTKCYGMTLIVFCSSKDQSKKTCAHLVYAGFNAKHIDSSCDEAYKDMIFGTEHKKGWLETSPGAILCNVRMTTTGFDAPFVQGTVLNMLSKSLCLVQQARARSATPYKFPDDYWNKDLAGTWKKYHVCIDICDNTIAGGHGEWSDDVDWERIFYNPKFPRAGVPPKKSCEICEAINPASARFCVVCEAPFEMKSLKEIKDLEMEMVATSGEINVKETIETFKDREEYASMLDLLRQTASRFKKSVEQDENFVLEEDDFNKIFATARAKIREWMKIKGKRKIDITFTSLCARMQFELESAGFVCNFESIDNKIILTSKI